MTAKKIFSIPHFESAKNSAHDDSYYQIIKNSTQEFKDEIHDIFFAKKFRYQFENGEKQYSNPMGLEATDAQVDNLFRIQNEFGIEISLTMNSIEIPAELLKDRKVAMEFIEFIKTFYDRGLRSCTIGSTHLIKSGILHQYFPEMRWKNTVNHRVSDAQQVLNFIFCGYDTILLDRSLSRNIHELRQIRKAVDYYNEKYKPVKKILTSLLTTEGCVYSCPFKKEHDAIGESISGLYFTTLSKITCDNWRFTQPFGSLPRNGIDLVAADKATFDEFAELNDIFKYSGRFSVFPFTPEDAKDKKACWIFEHQKQYRFDYERAPINETVCANSLHDAINDNVMPLHWWNFGWVDTKLVKKDYKNKLKLISNLDNFWLTDKGRRLENILKKCRSQCWNCHECEKAFDTPEFDSSLQIREQCQ